MSQYPSNQSSGNEPQSLGRYGGPPPGPGMYEVSPAGSGSGDNPQGRAALGLAVVTVVIQVIGQFVFHSIVGNGNFGVVGAVSGWFNLGAVAFALLAMVLGIVGLRKPGAAKGAAGVGFGVGAYVVVMTLVNVGSTILLHGIN